jgi:hypothetical protein
MVAVAKDPKKKLSMNEAYEIQAGTWSNDEYSEIMTVYKFVIQPDGTFEGFPSKNIDLVNTGRLTILDTMIDSNGNIWIKAKNECVSYRKRTYYEIQKHSNSNMVMEVWDDEREGWWGEGFPTDLIPENQPRIGYRIYYRQE